MASEGQNYYKLQDCSQMISELIQAEKLYREGCVHAGDEAVELPDELLKKIKVKFHTIKLEVIKKLTLITV